MQRPTASCRARITNWPLWTHREHLRGHNSAPISSPVQPFQLPALPRTTRLLRHSSTKPCRTATWRSAIRPGTRRPSLRPALRKTRRPSQSQSETLRLFSQESPIRFLGRRMECCHYARRHRRRFQSHRKSLQRLRHPGKLDHNAPDQGKSYNTYNTSRKRWKQFWVDNSQGMIHFLGDLKDGVMDYWTDGVPQRDGKKLKRHLQFIPQGSDKVRQLVRALAATAALGSSDLIGLIFGRTKTNWQFESGVYDSCVFPNSTTRRS